LSHRGSEKLGRWRLLGGLSTSQPSQPGMFEAALRRKSRVASVGIQQWRA